MADPNEHWSEQFSDALVLRHLARHATDFVDRARAREMLDKAEAEMARAAKSAAFDAPLAGRYAQVARDGFKPVLSFRAWPQYAERTPDTSKLPAMVRTKRNAKPEHFPVWPTMRTRGLPGGMIG